MSRAAQITQAVSAMRRARASPRSDEILVRSASFVSYEGAKHAARVVHRGASRASFDEHSGAPPPMDLPALRDAATALHRVGAERWLDDGGGVSPSRR
jgi:hypothetical protein